MKEKEQNYLIQIKVKDEWIDCKTCYTEEYAAMDAEEFNQVPSRVIDLRSNKVIIEFTASRIG